MDLWGLTVYGAEKVKASPIPVGQLNKHKVALGFYIRLNSLLYEESGKRLSAFYASYHIVCC
jgi:hypothetical protein